MKTISAIISLLALIGLYWTAASIDSDVISYGQAIIQAITFSAIGLVFAKIFMEIDDTTQY